MSDFNTAESVVTQSSKAEYENSINLSQHLPQAKIISEMVLDAFQSTRESGPDPRIACGDPSGA